MAEYGLATSALFRDLQNIVFSSTDGVFQYPIAKVGVEGSACDAQKTS